MKNKTVFYAAIICFGLLFVFPSEITTQQRKKVVKRHLKKHGVINTKINRAKRHHKRRIKARRKAHFRYRHLPKRGKVVRTVGPGFVGLNFRGGHFRFHKGVWYKPSGKRFIVSRAPFGIRVRVLPIGYKRIVVGTRPYFYYYGTYYIKTSSQKEEYEVVNAPMAAEIDALPEGYTIVKAKGMEYYKLDDIYYEPMINESDEEYYIVVNDPTR